jgi:hypothetical protein
VQQHNKGLATVLYFRRRSVLHINMICNLVSVFCFTSFLVMISAYPTGDAGEHYVCIIQWICQFRVPMSYLIKGHKIKGIGKICSFVALQKLRN